MTRMRKVRIVNESPDADTVLTRVYDADTGEQLHDLTMVALHINATTGRTEVVLRQAMPFEYVGLAQIRVAALRPEHV